MNPLMKKWQRKGPITATAGTAFTLILPSSDAGRVVVTRATITNGATANVLSVMQAKGRDKVTVGGAASQAKFKIASANPCGIAANDWLIVRLLDGSLWQDIVSAVAAPSGGNIEITMTNNLPKAIEVGARVWFMDLPAIHEQVTLPTSAVTTYESEEGYFGADEMGDPVLLHCNNATNATKIDAVVCPIIAA